MTHKAMHNSPKGKAPTNETPQGATTVKALVCHGYDCDCDCTMRAYQMQYASAYQVTWWCCISMQETQHVCTGSLRTSVHLYCPAPSGLQHLGGKPTLAHQLHCPARIQVRARNKFSILAEKGTYSELLIQIRSQI